MNRVFLDILIVLVAAKLAAEIAERGGVPAVVGEILAGVVIGPSALALVRGGEVLHTLGEIGVILLLLEVGMQMDLRELRNVGRASLLVATAGVAVPFALGYVVAAALGLDGDQALFTAAALTATSVGITARVFGDLRALATVEARTVLGAAVADDVIGLVILTVVVRLVTGDGRVSVTSVGSVIAVAAIFLVVTIFLGVVLSPPLFALIDRFSRSRGTVVAFALAFALGIAQLASLAKLAPIVGAFVAGLALGRTSSSERIQRELAPVGHLFVPVFFLQIGIDTDVAQFVKGDVLKLAGALCVVAVVGKVVAGWAAVGSPGNKLLIGLGMIPRGEVGLIFAGIGLREKILGQNSYAAILLMVLATTLVTPPILKAQLVRVRRKQQDLVGPIDPRPVGGWLTALSGRIELVAHPPEEDLLEVAFSAALLMADAEPGPRLVEFLTTATPPPSWNRAATEAFHCVVAAGGPRSWRFLETTGVLELALPELASALRRRRLDPGLVDPAGVLRFPLLETIRSMRDPTVDPLMTQEIARLEHPERLALAALLLDVVSDEPEPLRTATTALERLGTDDDDASAVSVLISQRSLLTAAAKRLDGLDEESVLRIGAHLAVREQARALYALSVAQQDLEPWERMRLDELYRLVLDGLEHPELTGPQASTRVDARRAEAIALVAGRPLLADRIAIAPRSYILNEDAASIARHAALLHPLPAKGRFRVEVEPEREAGVWRVEVAARDQIGLLATVTGVMEAARLDVIDAVIATWSRLAPPAVNTP